MDQYSILAKHLELQYGERLILAINELYIPENSLTLIQ